MKTKTQRESIPIKWIAVGILALSLLLISVFHIVIRYEQAFLEQALLDRATLLATGIDPVDVGTLTGTEADLDQPQYIHLKDFLFRVRNDSPDVRFIYLMQRDAEGRIVILADSESPDSRDYSPPGDHFHEVDPHIHLVIDSRMPTVIGPVTDRWGTWISAYIPLAGTASAASPWVLGMDIDARDWRRMVLGKTIQPLFWLGLALWAGAAGYGWLWSHRNTGPRTRSLWERYGVGVPILLVGVSGSIYASYLSSRFEILHRTQLFSNIAQQEVGQVQRNIRTLRWLQLPRFAQFFEAVEVVTQSAFDQFAGGPYNETDPYSWAWVRPVTRDELSAVQQDKQVQFDLWEFDEQGAIQIAGDRDLYYPMLFIAPADRHLQSIGFDLSTDDPRWSAIQKSIQFRQPIATTPVELLGTDQPGPGIVIYYPVFRGGDPPPLRGLAVVGIFFERLLERFSEDGQVQLVGAVLGEDNVLIPIHDSGPLSTRRNRYSATTYLPFFGQILRLQLSSGNLFHSSHRYVAGFQTFVSGLLITLTVLALVAYPRGRKLRLEHEVRLRTEELNRIGSRFELLTSQAGLYVWETDKDGMLTYVSSGITRLLGYRPEELVYSFNVCDLAPPEDRDAIRSRLRFVLAKHQEESSFENRVVGKEGQVFWVLTSGTILHDKAGNVIGFRGLDADITQRKSSTAELQRLYTAIEQSPHSVVITNAQGVIEYVNSTFEKVSGYARQEVLGKNPRFLQSGQQDADFYRQLWSTISSGKIWNGQWVNQGKTGQQFTEEVSIAPVRNAEGQITHYVAIKRDITEEIAREEMLRESQKMDSIGRLAGGIAHDFNNLIGIILGYADLALENVDSSSSIAEELEEIRKAAKRSADLTRQLLGFARRQSVSPRGVELNETVAGMYKMLRRLIDETIELDWEPLPTPCPIKIDPTQLDQILVNLCVNARDAISGTGRISIRTAEATLSHRDCERFSQAVPGAYVVLSIEDTGCGMDKETLTHAFEPFYTTKQRGRGTGLGLATVYGIVAQNQGFIDVSSTEGSGTRVDIYFPRHESGDSDAVAIPAAASPQSSGSETVLLVEDEVGILNMTARMLSRQGYTVIPASSPEAGIAVATDPATTIDLLITDVIMPNMSGREMSERIQEQRPGLPCLYISGYSDEALSRNQVFKSQVPFLQKPFTVEQLTEIVRSLLDAPRSTSPQPPV